MTIKMSDAYYLIGKAIAKENEAGRSCIAPTINHRSIWMCFSVFHGKAYLWYNDCNGSTRIVTTPIEEVK